MIKIAPSILSANFAKLGEDIQEAEQGGADWIHVDVMDGQFVPNITIGPLIVEAIRPVTSLPLDVHLMIANPDQYIDAFASAGADLISVHAEACPHLHRTIQMIKQQGIKAGVALNPATPIEHIQPILGDIDFVLLMTVNPGFGGQSFIPSILPKIQTLSSWIKARQLPVEIQVDGGINEETAQLCIKAGASILVAGSAIYGRENRKQAIEALKQSAVFS